jgi:prevent-host-death family protein
MLRKITAVLRSISMPVVSSAEVQKNFGRFKDTARTEPVVVTQYGKPAVVILDAAEYARLKELDRRVLRLDDMSDSEIEEMLQAEIPPQHRYSLADIPD